jgi:RimJ/RimL family protein N-acetyltransferase
MFALWSAPEVCLHSGPASDSAGLAIPLPASRASDSDRLLGFWLDRAQQGTGFRWAVMAKQDDAFVGAVGFNALGECAEYAYHFLPDDWGKGYAAEAARLALGWVFEYGARNVEAFITSENARSIRLVERLGFTLAETEADPLPRWVLAGSAQLTPAGRR